tara:strand:- start:525 stop:653 length:129 start_codon:yes stop_codon:yes gene_type:complete
VEVVLERLGLDKDRDQMESIHILVLHHPQMELQQQLVELGVV